MHDRFWLAWEEIGKDLLEYGQEIQFGNSLVEVKFAAGIPTVIVRSKSIKRKYPNNMGAEMAIAEELRNSEKSRYEGARTFTVAYHDGNITQVLLDQYASTLLK